MAFQTPFEIAQSRLLRLWVSSVEASEVGGRIFPFFDEAGVSRFLVIDTQSGGEAGGGGGLWVVEEFPLEIRLRKAIYPRPIRRYRSLSELEPETVAGLYHFDSKGILATRLSFVEAFAAALSAGNVALRSRGRESIRDVFFTLDLRRLTGGVSRQGLFLQRRLELAGLRSFIETTAPSPA